MYIQQLYTSCLAEAAYYIESDGEAAIIDPLRETAPYLELAQKRNAKIKYIFETHFHADFVSGHIDLARKTGAKIIYGPTAIAGYEIMVADDEQDFPLGKINLRLLHTPGHTMESSCILLMDEQHKTHSVFTGDTLFVGDVGRPDLAVKSDLSKEDLAGYLYDSIHTKLMTLPDEVLIYPGHGAGSACGKNIGKETVSTIGEQKKNNYALCCANKDEFVKAVTTGLDAPPKYFFIDAAINKKGYDSIDEVMAKNAVGISISQIENEVKKGAILLDTRSPEAFEQGFIPGSINIGLNGQYAVWVGALLDHATPILVVADEGREAEAVLRLARVGYEHVYGYLEGGFESWVKAGKPIDLVDSVEAEHFAELLGQAEHKVIDVRNPSEWTQGIVEGAELVPLSELEIRASKLDKEQPFLVHCAGGYRSMMAISILKKLGFNKVKNVQGGINKIKEHGFMLVIPEEA